MSDSSRREFLGSLGQFALVPLIVAAPISAPTQLTAENANGKMAPVRAGAIDNVKVVKIDTVRCPDWPLQSLGATVVQGDPEASGKTVFESEDHRITGGLWQCSPGVFDLTFTWDEMALLLEGELIIEEPPGRKVRVLPGEFFFVPRGAKTRWIVIKPLRKLFFSREQVPAQEGA